MGAFFHLHFFDCVQDCATSEEFQITEPVYSFYALRGKRCAYLDSVLDGVVRPRKAQYHGTFVQLSYVMGSWFPFLIFLQRSGLHDRLGREVTEPVLTALWIVGGKV